MKRKVRVGAKSIASQLKMWLERTRKIAAYNRAPPGTQRRTKRTTWEYR